MYPYPLGLPKGSIRATITMLLTINLVILTLQENILADALATSTAIALTFYFGGKMRARGIPTDVDRSQRAWGLPAGTIRVMLIIIFGGTAGYMFWQTNEIPVYLMDIIYIIAGFLFGRVFNKMFNRDKAEEDGKPGFIGHGKALLVLIIAIGTIVVTHIDLGNEITQLMIFVNSVALAFYFGAR